MNVHLSKIVLTFDMLAGRLEMFPMLVLLSPTTWKDTPAVLKRRAGVVKRKIAGKGA